MLGSLTNVWNIAASGLAAADAQLQTTAGNIANLDTPGYQAKRVDLVELSGGGVGVAGTTSDTTRGPVNSQGAIGSNVDLATESVNLIQAKILYTANAAVLHAADQMYGSLLDMFDNGSQRRDGDGSIL